MYEWFDRQRKPTSDYRKELQEQIDKVNPRRTELTNQEQLKLDKLKGILDTLKRGENEQNRQLQSWLSADEYE